MYTTTSSGGAAVADNGGPISQDITNFGLGYAIAIALGFLVLLSTLLLASYICCRASRNHHHHHHHHNHNHHRQNPNPNNPTTASDGIILPRIIFVAEEDESENEPVVVGLEQAVISSYPKFPFSKAKEGNETASCSICLCEYKDGEMLRMMPDCRHFFHICCLDAWLRLNGSCPVCRNSPLPTPLSTPLSEVVPLSQYSGGRRR